MNDLEKYFNNNQKNLIHKWNHYFNIYNCYFSRFRNTSVNVLEIGVSHGGSLQMWKDYFGSKCQIFGIDRNSKCKQLEENRVQIFIGNQTNESFLEEVIQQIPHIDILIDDGGHRMEQQIVTFKKLFPHIDKNGVYLCEDIHTSYYKRYEGGYKCSNSFIEYSKNLIDDLHAWHYSDSITEFTTSTYALHYYNGVLVIEKKPITKPFHTMTGHKKI